MKIAVIGAGFGGLSAAYDLVKAGHQVTVFEASATSGGLASGFKEPGWKWSVEKFYHHWFTSDKHMFGLIRELGLEQKVRVRSPKTVMYFKDKFYPFDSFLPPSFIRDWDTESIRYASGWWSLPAPDQELAADGEGHGRGMDA
jgi:protoporphyrinogen oxidase